MNQSAKANGFSLVEVMVAMIVLAVGILAMAASTGYISAEIRNASWNTQRSMAREQIIEQLKATPFDSVLATTAPQIVGRFSMTWQVLPVGATLKQVQLITSGPGYRMGQGTRSTVIDTVVVSMARP